MVHLALEAVGRLRRHRSARSISALICVAALAAPAAGCGGSSDAEKRADEPLPAPAVGSVKSADCADWKRGTVEQRRSTVAQLRKFAGGPVGSSTVRQYGRVLDDERAYRVLQSYCRSSFARGFKLYKLYERAAAFVGR